MNDETEAADKPKFKVWQLLILAAALSLVAVAAINPEIVSAGTAGTEFDTVFNRAEGGIEGGGGRLAAVMGLIFAVVGSIRQFSFAQILGAIGVGAACGLGVDIVTTGVSAVI
ncbi:MAG: hypothetical protein GYB26_09955 [Gammaproteobacteria bacterium]|nr:hypothetical protein [Gammaproteobacteria bacterium]